MSTAENKQLMQNIFAEMSKGNLDPFIDAMAEGDYMVIEHSGKNTTPDGRPYNNKYCWVCRFSEGKLRELREYMDTGLVIKTFGNDDES